MSFLFEEPLTDADHDSLKTDQFFLGHSNQSLLPQPRGFLLTMGNYLGTLAAVRDLGSHGIPVVVADSQECSLAAVSRYVSRFEKAPSLKNLEVFVQWLIEFGRKNPGYVLYPTSDEICLIIAHNYQELSKYYYLCQDPTANPYLLLNKEKLSQLCQILEIDYPKTWFPASRQERYELADAVRYPVLVKPKTQAGMSIPMKGKVCQSKQQLIDVLSKFDKSSKYKGEALQYDPSLSNLVVQEFHPEAAENIYSLAGFFDSQNNVYVLRASEKVLQQPVKIGVGICFESREVYDKLAQQLRRLLEKVSYRGAFEAEFIHLKQENRFLLIDLNPRFYGQMGFEIARGLPMARLCYFAAIGAHKEVRELSESALQWDHKRLYKYRALPLLNFFATTQWIGGSMSKDRRQFWLEWAKTGSCYDPIYDSEDSKPGWVFFWQGWMDFLRHPRSTYYKFFCA